MIDIEDFITEFRDRQAGDWDDGSCCVRGLFGDGYSYYFAKMLEAAYPGGQVCLAFPKKHFVYRQFDMAWDINGRYIDKAWWFSESQIPHDVLRPLKCLNHNPNVYKDVDAWIEQKKAELKDYL